MTGWGGSMRCRSAVATEFSPPESFCPHELSPKPESRTSSAVGPEAGAGRRRGRDDGADRRDQGSRAAYRQPYRPGHYGRQCCSPGSVSWRTAVLERAVRAGTASSSARWPVEKGARRGARRDVKVQGTSTWEVRLVTEKLCGSRSRPLAARDALKLGCGGFSPAGDRGTRRTGSPSIRRRRSSCFMRRLPWGLAMQLQPCRTELPTPAVLRPEALHRGTSLDQLAIRNQKRCPRQR